MYVVMFNTGTNSPSTTHGESSSDGTEEVGELCDVGVTGEPREASGAGDCEVGVAGEPREASGAGDCEVGVAGDPREAGVRNVLVDSFGRKHNYLRISLTERCNLRCE